MSFLLSGESERKEFLDNIDTVDGVISEVPETIKTVRCFNSTGDIKI